MLALSYHQVMPSFLDFLFSFGRQEHAQDFYFSAFRSHCSVGDSGNSLRIPQFGRSGRSFEICYNLKSVENSKYHQDWPWSVRQCAVYHSFDVTEGRATWIILEADPLMKRRLASATASRGLPEMKSFQTVSQGFKACLATHLILAEWSSNNWRWYINFLEDQCQATRSNSSKPVEPSSTPTIDESVFSLISRADTETTRKPMSPTFPRALTGNTLQEPMEKLPYVQTAICDKPVPWNENQSWREGQPQRHHEIPQEIPPFTSAPSESDEAEEQVTFSDLQRIHFIKEKLNEAKLVISLDMKVFKELTQFYTDLIGEVQWSEGVREACKLTITHFTKRLKSIRNDLQTQQMRIDMLLHLLADRKGLV